MVGKQIQENITKANGKLSFTTLDIETPTANPEPALSHSIYIGPSSKKDPTIKQADSDDEKDSDDDCDILVMDPEIVDKPNDKDKNQDDNNDEDEDEDEDKNKDKKKDEGEDIDEIDKIQLGVVRKSSIVSEEGITDAEPELDDNHPPSLPVAFGYGFSKSDDDNDEANMDALSPKTAQNGNANGDGNGDDVVINTGTWILNGTPR